MVHWFCSQKCRVVKFTSTVIILLHYEKEYVLGMFQKTQTQTLTYHELQ